MQGFTKKTMVLSMALLLCFLLADLASAATLTGAIYDNNLELVKNAVVTISTMPLQQYVAKEGTYAFEVKNGTYTIEVQYKDRFGDSHNDSEDVTITDTGYFVYDFIVFSDSIDSLDENIGGDLGGLQEDLNIIEGENKGSNMIMFGFILLVLIFIIILIGILVMTRRRHTSDSSSKNQSHSHSSLHEDDDAKEVLDYIKEQGGRVTQKMLRERFPFSEAKVSLIVSELVHKGNIEKIKRGKGNLILLKRN